MLYDQIKKLAVEMNTSIAELERTLGLANGTISKWNNVSPNSESLYKVAKFFNLTMEDLMKEKIKEEG